MNEFLHIDFEQPHHQLIRWLEKAKDESLPEWQRHVFDFIAQWFDANTTIVQQSSGSTGTPKNIILKKSAMLASAQRTLQFFHLQKGASVWLCLPMNYIAGKMMLVRAIAGQLKLIVSEPAGTPLVPSIPIDFTAMVPLQVLGLTQNVRNFSHIKQLIIGGAGIDFTLQKAIQQLPTAVYATYGMSETCSHIALQRLNGKNPDKAFNVLPGIAIGTNNKGCLSIDAPDLLDSKLETNDLVNILSPGHFQWLGRSDFIINSGGIKISPEQLEKEISAIIQQECFIVPQSDPILGQRLVLVLEQKANITAENSMLQQIKKVLGKHRTPKAVYYMNEFPRNASMKIDRAKLIQNIKQQYGNSTDY
jgi:O-succinylbenzoic acid--CoA ligase